MDLRSIAPPGQSDAVDMLLSYGSNRHHPTADPNMGDTSLQAKKQHRKFIAACHRTGLPKGRHIKPQYYPSATYPAPAISSYQLQQSTHLYSAFLLALRVRCKWLVAKLFFAACYFFNPQKIKTMYHIKKSEDSWTIRNGDTGRSRKLTWLEMLAVMNEFPELGCQQVTSVYVEEIESVKYKPL